MEEKLLSEILAQMVRIADSLDIIARAGAPQEPNYIKPIGEYKGFDWATIGATVVNQDADGPTHLEWGGFIWTRRSPVNKYKPAIWYSRGHGKDAEGNVNYLKLITFKTIEDADPIPGKVAAAIPVEITQRPAAAPASLPTSAPVTSTPTPRSTTPSPASPAAPTNGKIAEPKSGEAVNAQTYYTLGNGRKWNLPREMLADIASFAGVDLKAKQPDFAIAFALLPYFAEGKAGGVGLATLKEILQSSGMDVHQAIPVMRGKLRS